jgi:O-antigen ligase
MVAIVKKYFFNPAFLIWFIIFCIVPFIHSNLTIDPDYVPKMFVFAGLIILLSAIFIFDRSAVRFFNRRLILFWILLGAYLISLIFSLINSLNPGDAVFDAIHVIAPFLFLPLMLAAMDKDQDSLIWIFRLQNIAVIIFSVYGGIQFFEALEKATAVNESFKVEFTLASTLGNKNFFSETLLMLLPFSLAGIVLDKSIWKWLNVLVSVTIIVEIIFLKSDSVLAGLCAGIVVAVFIALIFNQRSRRIFSTWKSWTVLTVFLATSIFIMLRSQIYQNAIQKIKQTTATFTKDAREEILISDEVNRNSSYTRWFLWRNTYYLIREKPITGIGMGNWKAYYAKYGVSGAYYLNGGTSRFEHPHNEYLLMFCERGLIAFLLWIGLLTTLFIYAINIYRRIPNSAERFLMLCMMGGIAGFSVICLFGYPLYRSYSPVMLVLIAAVILYYRNKSVTVGFSSRSLIVFTPIACAGIFIMFVLVKRYQGEVNMAKALQEQSRLHFDRMNRLVTEADSYFFPLDLTTTPLNWYRGFSFFHNQQTDSALVYFHKAELQSPYHIQVLNDLGACYENRGDHVKAMQYFDKVLKVTPLYEETMLNKIVTLYNTGRIEEAYALLHARTYAWSPLYLSCRRAIIGSVITELFGNGNNDGLVESAAGKLSSDTWISLIEDRSKGSISQLKKVLSEEFKK